MKTIFALAFILTLSPYLHAQLSPTSEQQEFMQKIKNGTVNPGDVLGSKAIEREIVVEGAVSFSNLQFKIDSTEFANQEAVRQLREIAIALKATQTKGTGYLIEGFTCDLGTENHNAELSLRRANAVRKQLVDFGVPQAALTTAGRGEASPLRPNDTETNRALNRRVVIVLKNS